MIQEWLERKNCVNFKCNGFCVKCADWLAPDGWQEDGRYFCPTCLDFVPVDDIWNMTAATAPE